MASFLTPPNWMNIQSICIYPEVIAIRISIEVQLYPVSTNLQQVKQVDLKTKQKKNTQNTCVHGHQV